VIAFLGLESVRWVVCDIFPQIHFRLLNSVNPLEEPFLYPLNVIQWWVWVNSNHRPHPYQRGSLTTFALGFVDAFARKTWGV